MEFSYRNDGKVIAFNHSLLKRLYFYAFIFNTSCSVAKKGKLNRYHLLRICNVHRNLAIITDAAVINITARIIKKISDNSAQSIWQIPGKYLHPEFFKRM